MTTKPVRSVKAGMRLSFISTVATGVFQFLTMSVLARLLSPGDYGIYALCLAVITLGPGFVNNVAERFLVIHFDDALRIDLTWTIMLLCLLVGATEIAVCAALQSAGLLAIRIDVLAMVCLGAVISAGGVAPRSALRRTIHFAPLVGAEMAGLFIGQGAIAIMAARYGWGAYALAWSYCAQLVIVTAVLRWKGPKSAHVELPNVARLRSLMISAAGPGSNSALEIVNTQLAPLILGNRFGPVALGLFNRAYSLTQIPIQLMLNAIGRVMMSALFAVSDDPDLLRGAARRIVLVTGILVTPVVAGIAAASRNFVLCAFGSRWVAAVPLIALLACAAWATMIGTIFAVIAETLRAYRDKFRVQLVSTMALIVFALAGSRFGLIGATIGITAASFVFLLLYTQLTARLLDAKWGEMLAPLVPGCVVGAPCGVLAWLIGMTTGFPVLAVFVLQIGACGIALVAMLLLFYPDHFSDLAEIVAPGLLRRIRPLNLVLRR